MKKNFTASILKKIHAKKNSPRERYYFIAKRVLQLFSGIAFLIFGMLSVALVWHLIHNFEFLEFIWDKPQILGKLLWFGVPLFWMIAAAALWVVTEQVVQRTERAYRVPFWIIGTGILLLQVLGGLALEQSNVGERIDAGFEKRMEWYNGAERINRRMERMPEKGFLVGEIVEVKSDTFILLNDMTNKEWEVQFEHIRESQPELEEGMKIRMVGEMKGENEFLAFSWKPARKRPQDGRPKEFFQRKGDPAMRGHQIDRLRMIQERN